MNSIKKLILLLVLACVFVSCNKNKGATDGTDEPEINVNLPEIYIETEGKSAIVSKDEYLQATIQIKGMGMYDDYEGATRIRGRGHSTWTKPKQPFRLKLDKKAPLFGLKEEKDWVLLANHYDETSMLNAVAFKIGHLLNMPYTNSIIPVNVYINGEFRGSYGFTEQVEASASRVNIEDGGELFEIDSYYDEDYKFQSSYYTLPMQVKHPDLKDNPETAAAELNRIQTDFQAFEQQVHSTSFPNNNYLQQFDADAFINFLIVNMLTDNAEIGHPKSTYMYKPKGGKYTMGPIWDFDWAFSYDEDTELHFKSYSNPTLNPSKVGSIFFLRLLQDPTMKTLFKQKWASFKSSKLPALLQYVDDYGKLIKYSQKRDVEHWGRGSRDFDLEVRKIKSWLQGRAKYMDSYVAGL